MKKIIFKSKQAKPVEIQAVLDYGQLLAIRLFAENHIGQGAIIPTTPVSEVKKKLGVAIEVCEGKIKDINASKDFCAKVLRDLEGV